MSNILKIAIIGGIGSGKSSVTKYLAQRGFDTLDCDVIAKQVMADYTFEKKVCEQFPEAVNYGRLDRKILGQVVFGNKSKLKLLNTLVHPQVKLCLEQSISQLDKEVVFVEASVFIDSIFEHMFDKVVCVVAEEEIRINRIMKRNSFDRQHCLNIIASQPTQKQLLRVSDYLVTNNGDVNQLHSNINVMLKEFNLVD